MCNEQELIDFYLKQEEKQKNTNYIQSRLKDCTTN